MVATVIGLVAALVAARGGAAEDEAGLGLRAPDCELAVLDEALRGEAPSVRRLDFEGRVTLVDFWASWCPTCERAFGFLDDLARDFRAAGLTVVAVNLDADPRDARDFLKGRSLAFEVAYDATGACPRGFGLVGMPQAFLVDATGRVRAVTRGFRPGEAQALRSQIAGLLAGEAGATRAHAQTPGAAR